MVVGKHHGEPLSRPRLYHDRAVRRHLELEAGALRCVKPCDAVCMCVDATGRPIHSLQTRQQIKHIYIVVHTASNLI